MITPEQQAKINEWKQSNNFTTAAATSKPSGFDLVDRELAKRQITTEPAQQDVLQNLGQAYQQAPGVIAKEANLGNTGIGGEASNAVSKNPIVRAGENALGATNATLNTIFAPFGAIAKSITDTASKAIEKNPAIMQNPIFNKVLDFVNSSQNEITKLSQEHPEAARNLGNALNVALLTIGSKGAGAEKPIIPGEFTDLKPLGSAIKQGVKDSVGDLTVKGSPAGIAATKLGEKIAPPPTLPELTGRITGATGEEVPTATKGLQGIDLTTPLKKGAEYKDFSSRLEKGGAESQKVADEGYAKNPNKYTTNELTTKTTSGKFGVNYVKQALSDLKDLYSVTKEGGGNALERIKGFQTKLSQEGLTATDINNISKEYGKQFKAFKTNNQIKAGKIAAGAENVRSGLKDTARNLLTDDAAKIADKQTSDIIKTKEMVDELNTKVDAFKNNFRPGSPLQKMGAMVARIVDRVSGGAVKGIFKELLGASGAGEGTKLNILQLQKELQKNIDLFNKVNKMKPEEGVKTLSSFSEGVIPKITPTKEIEPLAQEARKYKSAEEFVKVQPTVYHGTSGENAIKINTEGFKTGSGKGVSGQTSNDFIYATENKVSAGRYVSDRLGIKNPTTVSGSFNGKVLDISGSKMADFEAFGEASKKLGVPLEIGSQGKPTMLNMPAIKKAMQEQGYGAIRFSDRYANGSKALAILPDNIKTKSQLTDIYNQATKGVNKKGLQK